MDAVEEVKSRLDVSELLGSYIQLKPAGANLKGLCPFHNEKTPSLMVNDEKGIWHCFGCGEGGDIFSFLMKMEGLEFRDALERLAEKTGVTLEESVGGRGQAKVKEGLRQANELAAKYYQAVLTHSKTAQNYLKQRDLKQSVIKEFGLGFAPAGGDALSKALLKRKLTGDQLVKAGLARKKGNQLVDVFRNRLMIPISEGTGQPVAFTGRLIDAKSFGPKYLNTPQTLIFNKGRLLFGMAQARDAIRQQDEAVVVEGNLDVLSSHQSGIKNVVASGGTALTIHQLKNLSKITRNIKLAFDTDSAGLAATEKAIPLAQEVGASLYIVELPDAKDPDELIKRSPKLWAMAIKQAPYVMDWLLKTLQGQYDLSTVPGKKRFSDRVMAVLSRLPDPVEQEHYAKQLADVVGVSAEAIMRKLNQANTPATKLPPKKPAMITQAQPIDEHRTVEEALLGVAVAFADTRVSLQDLSDDHFGNEDRRKLFNYLRNNPEASLDKSVPRALQSVSNYVKILFVRGEDEYQDWAPLDRRIEAFSLANRLQTLFIKKSQKDLQKQLETAEAAGDKDQKDRLLKQFRDISRKL